MTVQEVYRQVKCSLRNAGIESCQTEAIILLQHVCGIPKEQLLLDKRKKLAEEHLQRLQSALDKRVAGYPLQYILGEWEFYGLSFSVGEGVLIPRGETEILCEAAMEDIWKRSYPTVLDLCSGSGCVAITIQKHCPGAKVFAVEKSEKALEYLRINADRNLASLDIIQGDVREENLVSDFPEMDVITANPPYLTEKDMQTLQKEVTFEPAEALFGDKDGLLFYREIARIWKPALKPGGKLFFEIGIGQERDVEKILQANGYHSICYWKDYCGIIRVVAGKK